MTQNQLEDIVWVYGLIAMLVHDKMNPQVDAEKTEKAFDELYNYVWANREMLFDGRKGIRGNFGVGCSDGRKMVIELKIGLGD